MKDRLTMMVYPSGLPFPLTTLLMHRTGDSNIFTACRYRLQRKDPEHALGLWRNIGVV